jgi:hypothetical protein
MEPVSARARGVRKVVATDPWTTAHSSTTWGTLGLGFDGDTDGDTVRRGAEATGTDGGAAVSTAGVTVGVEVCGTLGAWGEAGCLARADGVAGRSGALTATGAAGSALASP